MHKFWSLGLGVFDEVSVSSRNFNQVSVSKVTVSTTSLANTLVLRLKAAESFLETRVSAFKKYNSVEVQQKPDLQEV